MDNALYKPDYAEAANRFAIDIAVNEDLDKDGTNGITIADNSDDADGV